MCPGKDPVHYGGSILSWDVVLYLLVIQLSCCLWMYLRLYGLSYGKGDT